MGFIKYILRRFLPKGPIKSDNIGVDVSNPETQVFVTEQAELATSRVCREFDRTHFYSTVKVLGALTQTQVDGINMLLDFMERDESTTDLRHFAYMLATVRHETAATYLPIIEKGGKSRAEKLYGSHTKIGENLGNLHVGDGAKFMGRGYVQLTGRRNYGILAFVVNNDILNNPEEALVPDISYKIMSAGMRRGLFTGRSLSQYIVNGRCDYTQARRIINGIDKAGLITTYARVFERALKLVE